MMATFLRGLRLLRFPELVSYLGRLQTSLEQVKLLSDRFPKAVINCDVSVQGWRDSGLELGEGVRIEKGAMLALGDELNGYGRLRIGARTWVGQYSNWRLGKDAVIEVGEDCLIGQFCSFVGINHCTDPDVLVARAPAETRKLGVRVDSGAWIGAGAVVLPGVHIGAGAVIGANSVVTRDVGPNEIWAGVPARRIRDR